MQTLPSTALVPNPFQREHAPDEGAAPEEDASRGRRLKRETAPEGDASREGGGFIEEAVPEGEGFSQRCIYAPLSASEGEGSKGKRLQRKQQ